MVITPTSGTVDNSKPKIFLAGTIDNGESANWQEEVIIALETISPEIQIINPRRESWDKSASQKPDNAELVKQIQFELLHLQTADAVLMWLAPESKSPISLLELGILCGQAHGTNRAIVGTTEDFYRYANIVVTTNAFKVPLVGSLNELISQANAIMQLNFARRIPFTIAAQDLANYAGLVHQKPER